MKKSTLKQIIKEVIKESKSGEFLGIRTRSQKPIGKWQQVGGKYKRDDDAVKAAKSISNKENVDTYVSTETHSDMIFVLKRVG